MMLQLFKGCSVVWCCVGLHVKLRDAKWALAVEACIGRALLSGFVVDNGDDKKVLQSLIRSLQWRGGERQPVIVMTRFLVSHCQSFTYFC